MYWTKCTQIFSITERWTFWKKCMENMYSAPEIHWYNFFINNHLFQKRNASVEYSWGSIMLPAHQMGSPCVASITCAVMSVKRQPTTYTEVFRQPCIWIALWGKVSESATWLSWTLWVHEVLFSDGNTFYLLRNFQESSHKNLCVSNHSLSRSCRKSKGMWNFHIGTM